MELINFRQILSGLGINRLKKSITKSAFVQNRIKVSPKVFKFLMDSMNQEFYSDNDERVKTWDGKRILVVDGSFYTLPQTEELIKKYKITRNQHENGVVLARASFLYDVENKMFLDGLLVPMEIGEREAAFYHLDYCKQRDLVIYDRGYPSFELLFEHNRRSIDCLFRCTSDFNSEVKKFVESDRQEDIVEFRPAANHSFKGKNYYKNSRVTVRLIKIQLQTGEPEILITSLLDKNKYPFGIFKEIYRKRWGIETGIDIQKNKIQVINFSGYSDISIQQDFYCALFVANLHSLLTEDIEEEINKRYGHRKFKYKINTSLAIGVIKTKLIEIFFKEDKENILEELKALLLEYVEPVRPNRSYERKVGKYRCRIKPVITKNFKNNL
jgi:hypothetical protein